MTERVIVQRDPSDDQIRAGMISANHMASATEWDATAACYRVMADASPNAGGVSKEELEKAARAFGDSMFGDIGWHDKGTLWDIVLEAQRAALRSLGLEVR